MTGGETKILKRGQGGSRGGCLRKIGGVLEPPKNCGCNGQGVFPTWGN